MHKINVATIGSKNFNTSLEELKDHLNFKLITFHDDQDIKNSNNFDILIVHEDFFDKDKVLKKTLITNKKQIKILASHSRDSNLNFFNDLLCLPTCIRDLNLFVENSLIKSNFSKNSSINIKDYILDKNEKKLIKKNLYILLTEKEIQLLELLLHSSEPINKNRILKEVWKYAAGADTHTVETHIYRLRKKIKSVFLDENFILNNKEGYLL